MLKQLHWDMSELTHWLLQLWEGVTSKIDPEKNMSGEIYEAWCYDDYP